MGVRIDEKAPDTGREMVYILNTTSVHCSSRPLCHCGFLIAAILLCSARGCLLIGPWCRSLRRQTAIQPDADFQSVARCRNPGKVAEM